MDVKGEKKSFAPEEISAKVLNAMQQVANLKFPSGERYLTLMVATSEPGLEGTFSFSVRTFDSSPCEIELLTPPGEPAEWERRNMLFKIARNIVENV